MKSGYSCVLNACIYAVILNLVLPMVAKPFATPEEIKPPNGADKLSFKSQLMHMLVHHAQVPLTSSLIIVLIVSLSMVLGYRFKIIQ
tara:strand:+ start:96 stop:356 length:261 start_codon:yes stop_codon:yes gene_type:complete